MAFFSTPGLDPHRRTAPKTLAAVLAAAAVPALGFLFLRPPPEPSEASSIPELYRPQAAAVRDQEMLRLGEDVAFGRTTLDEAKGQARRILDPLIPAHISRTPDFEAAMEKARYHQVIDAAAKALDGHPNRQAVLDRLEQEMKRSLASRPQPPSPP